MPLTTDEPIITEQINHWHVNEVRLYPNGQSATIVVWCGYNDGAELSFVQHETVTVTGDEFIAAMSTVTTGKTLYAEIKDLIYPILRARGVVPAEAVES